jgi:NADH:ubiquinone oxidoreductase subunit K
LQNWINFWSLLFWLGLILFSSNLNNLIKLIFYSELIWIVLYCYILLEGSLNDDLNLLSTSIFILGLAGLEYSIGILLLMLFKNLNSTLDLNNLNKTNNKTNIFNINNLYINRYIWSN